MAKVFLDDGTVIVATLNMNTFESDTEVDEEVFKDNISDVSYEENGEVVELGECTLVYGGLQDGKWQCQCACSRTSASVGRYGRTNNANCPDGY